MEAAYFRGGRFLMNTPPNFSASRDNAIQQFTSQQLIPRLWAKDVTVWSAQPAEQEAIRNRLGWLSISSVMARECARIETIADSIRRDGFTHALLLGMGGSSLFPEVCRGIFGVESGWLDLAVLDSTDPSAILAAQQRAPLERTLILVSSKSGSTIEVSTLCDYFYEEVRKVRGAQAGRQFIAITDEGTPLEALATQRNFREIFVHGADSGQDVGGRFSALTYFGLVPAALIGMNIRRFLDRAESMKARCQADVPLAENPGVQLGAFLSVAAASGKDKVTLAFPEKIAPFGAWVEQLVAESTGKSGKGLVPIDREPILKPAQYPADRVFVELQLEGHVDEALARAMAACEKAGHPVIRLRWEDTYDLGGETMRWAIATALAAWTMQINPFDEPNVQESKDRTKEVLTHYVKEGAFPAEPPQTGDQAAAVTNVLRQAREGDYLALLSFLPRTPEIDQAVESFRMQLAQRLPIATTLGYGPRYLHSSGQLHKGGSDRGLFLVLTADDPVDVAIPGKPYTFRVLKQAQALGDVQALIAHQRRVLRVQLGAEPLKALRQLLETHT